MQRLQIELLGGLGGNDTRSTWRDGFVRFTPCCSGLVDSPKCRKRR
jgi:hypothetical protein